MNEDRPRLWLLRVLVISLFLTLGGRLYYLQILSGHKYATAAKDNQIREVITPAARGAILDEVGTPLVRNRTALVVKVSYFDLLQQKDRGKAVVARVAKLIGMDPAELKKTITPCGPKVPKPCWNGSPQQPVPVATYDTNDNAAARRVLPIEELKDVYPGVTAGLEAVREYPAKSLAAHSLGYISQITQDELDKAVFKNARPADQVGRAGLERTYNSYLAGRDGVQQLLVNRNERQIGTLGEQVPQAGDSLVLSMDAKVQRVAEDALDRWTKEARTRADRNGAAYRAGTAAAVVLDATNGRVIALAGLPTYDPTAFIGGISQKKYDALLNAPGSPLNSQATQGLYAPGSTFKIATTAAVVTEGSASLSGSYACPPIFTLGTGHYSNFEGEGLGSINLRTALIKSCDTVFYKFAADDWYHDGALRQQAGLPPAKEAIAKMARSFGFGHPTGIDLPSESGGRIADRAYKQALYVQMKPVYCARAKTGYPEVKDPVRSAFLHQLAVENCADGNLFRGGDAVIQAVGQGDTVVTPLQLAVAYSALANGGTLYKPMLAKAAIGPDGKVAKLFTPSVAGHLPVSEEILSFEREALSQVPVSGTGAYAFTGFPLNKVPVAGKTGTAEVFGKQDTSWFASFAPANDPKFVVVGMIAEGGQGGLGAARMVRDIYDGIYGFGGKPAALPDGVTPKQLPRISADGVVRAPIDAPKAKPSPKPSGSPSPSPSPSAAAVFVLGVGVIGRARRWRKRQ